MIDKRLLENTSLIGESALNEIRLMHDGELDWFLVIPKVEAIEIIDLSSSDQRDLWDEVAQVSTLLKKNTNFDKLNIGSLGNMVPYLHIHVVARLSSDRAWPGAIWGSDSKQDFSAHKIEFWREVFKKTSFAI